MCLSLADELTIELLANQDEDILECFLKQYENTLSELVMFAFNPAIVTLGVLNYFPIKTFHVPDLLAWNLSGIPSWEKCQNALIGH